MNSSVKPYVIIVIMGIGLFFPFLGSVHLFDWDEINFAESAREMIYTGNYAQVTINFQGFWEKPPLFIWLQSMSMHLFGVNEFAARFPNALFGVLTLCYLYYFSEKHLKQTAVGKWWVLCYAAAITPQFYFKTGLIDPIFNGFIVLSILEFFKYLIGPKTNHKHWIMAGLFTGIAILLKGPVAILVSGLVLMTLLFIRSYRQHIKPIQIVLYGLTSALVASIWFLPETLANGPYFIVQFIEYQIGLFSQNIAGHQQPFYYHVVVLLFGCFPVSVIAIAFWPKSQYELKSRDQVKTSELKTMSMLMLIVFWVVLILFSIVKTKIVHYSSLCWLPLSYLAADGIVRHKAQLPKWSSILIALIGGLLGLAVLVLPVCMIWFKADLINLVKDPFAKANLSANVQWHYYDLIPAALLLISTLLWVLKSDKRFTRFTLGKYLGLQIVFVYLTGILFTPKIEAHTQGALIDFYSAKQNENCYWFVTGYKSYAAYFYAKIKPLKPSDGLYQINQNFLKAKKVDNYLALSETDKNKMDDEQKDWLLHGQIDKPVYFIAKSHDQEGLEQEKHLIKVWEANGFIAYKRP